MSPSKTNTTSAELKLSVEAKEFLLYSKIFRFMAYIAMFVGFVTSFVIYDKISDGDFSIIFERPGVIFKLFIPFLPTAMLASIAHSKRKKFYKRAEKDGFDIKGLRKHADLYSHNKVKQN